MESQVGYQPIVGDHRNSGFGEAADGDLVDLLEREALARPLAGVRFKYRIENCHKDPKKRQDSIPVNVAPIRLLADAENCDPDIFQERYISKVEASCSRGSATS